MAEPFTRKDVERVAELARLALTADEQELFARQLGEILAYAQHVQEVDTTGVPPTAHALLAEMPMREDELRESLRRDEALAGAPSAAAGLFKVPRVMG